jgi:hypothetical protein
MEIKSFRALFLQRMEEIKKRVLEKEAEYTRGGQSTDRFMQFKDAAIIDNEHQAEALWGMWKKHIVTLKYLKNDLIQNNKVDLKKVKEVVGDNIIYSMLFEGMCLEEIKKDE